MSFPSQALTPDFSVAPQLTPEAMVQAAQAGFKSVVNNRPDFEGGLDRPSGTQREQSALAA
ncbi:MAG: TIGR01244 family phosphatase, partial [Paucibacter sp.]|nr:TIGR01244 family phosphatase [Roseateles sp.]